MVKDTQKIRRQIAGELFECVSPFCEIGTYRVNIYLFRELIYVSTINIFDHA